MTFNRFFYKNNFYQQYFVWKFLDKNIEIKYFKKFPWNSFQNKSKLFYAISDLTSLTSQQYLFE